MMNLQTPGVYFQSVTKKPPTTALVRSDIAAFLGYARQGPVAVPVQIHSWRHYLSIFGEPYDPGYLAPAVKGFFENGGAICYIMRVTDDSAASASLALTSSDTVPPDYLWRFSASYLLSTSSSQTGEGTSPDSAQRLAAEQQGVAHAKRADNVGQWGNRVAISIDREALSNTQTIPGIMERGFITSVESITGLAANSIVELYQEDDGGGSVDKTVIIERVDLLNQDVYWKQSLLSLGFDLMRPIRLQSVEFAVQVIADNKIVERFAGLAIHPDHARFLVSVLNSESRYIAAALETQADVDESDYVEPSFRPPVTFNKLLSGGTDGLTGINADHFLAALKTLEKVEDIGVLAAPDLVLRIEESFPAQTLTTVKAFPCAKQLEALPKGNIIGKVKSYPEGTSVSEEGSVEPLPVAGVTVTYAAGNKQIRTAADGSFSFSNIETGLVTLRFEKSGYITSEQMTLAQENTDSVDFFLTPLLHPPALEDNDILKVQQAMANQAASFYRFALLDVPDAQMKLDQVRGWRQKLGDTAFAALYYPWLGVPSNNAGIGDGTLQWLPPCGHVAGIVAKTDLGEGVHRAPANVALRNVKRLSVEINDAQHGILNPEGINALRSFAGRGISPYGARTLSSDADWRYVNVRRLISALEKTLEKTMQWAVFESNNAMLRQAVTYNISALLNRLWRQGAFAGDKPEGAYAVKCNEDNNPSSVRDAGQLIAEVAVAPAIPFEFIIFKLGKTMEAIEVTE